MRSTVTALLSGACLLASAQSNWETLFRIDPEKNNGYFIVDKDKAAKLGVVQVKVEIIAAEYQPDGRSTTTILQTLTIDEGFYAQVDFQRWETLDDPYRVYYRMLGFDWLGNTVVDVESICDDCVPWPVLCSQTCEANLYAYSLVTYSLNGLAFIEFQGGTMNGEGGRLYVKNSDWAEFVNIFPDPWESFGIGDGGNGWDFILSNPDQSSVIRLSPSEVPAEARDFQGYLLGPVTGDVYAVAKGLGPWQGLSVQTGNYSTQMACVDFDVTRQMFNNDQHVQTTLASYSMDPLPVCPGMISDGDGLSWGEGCLAYYYNECNLEDPNLGTIPIEVLVCEGYTYGYDPDGTPEPGGSGPNGDYSLADVADILVYQWTDHSRELVMSVPVKGIEDPKLWKVEKTEVAAGLYEFRLIMNNARMLKRFVEFKGPTTLSADFAAFTHINIYPVPVKDPRFAIDLDLGMPLDINLTIVNNMGVTYYTKALSYPLSGKNKHIVVMGSAWPEGLYHAVFQYTDGSSESKSFTVDY